MTIYDIPFNKASHTGKEMAYIEEAIKINHISGDGKFTRRCQNWLENHFEVPKVLLTTSCTHALEMSALLLNISPGDEVIIPSFTFVSSINAFVLRGAKPVFADIRPDTLNIDENQIEGLITPKTKAIITVHYAGIGCEMTPIIEMARENKIIVIEDNAHGLFANYNQKPLGTFGSLATQSFHETKNITCGEGGALFINNPTYSERAEIIREKGTDRSRFFRGQIDKYTWVDIGSSYLPSDILAAFLTAQLESYKEIQAKREKIWRTYFYGLHSWAVQFDVKLPFIPDHCDQPFHMFYLIMPSLQARQSLINHLKEHRILAVFHYQPLHLSKMGLNYGGQIGDCPVTESTSDCLIRLPFYSDLNEKDQNRVIETINDLKDFPV